MGWVLVRSSIDICPNTNLGHDAEVGERDGLELGAGGGEGHEVRGADDGLRPALHVQPRDAPAARGEEVLGHHHYTDH